mmetsp:Transcript_25046/g.38862  ORF Transcript_25046/g.38862 Transcript_25046/m.38862 type:complete len:208 (+) Transcript_25046:364-987(+)
MLNRLEEANKNVETLVSSLPPLDEEETELTITTRASQMQEVAAILEKLEVELEKNKFGDLEHQMRKERNDALALTMTEEDKEFVEKIDDEYYKRVKTSDEFYRRKKLILFNLEKLQKKVESQAQNFDDYSRLKFIMLEKAKQKRSIVKNFVKLENFQKDKDRFYEREFHEEHEQFDPFSNEDAEYTYFDDAYGIESEYSKVLKEKIQ